MSPEMSNSQPMGSTWSNPAHPAATFCPAPSWWWLCLWNNLSPALGTHPPLRSNHTMVCDQRCLSWNRGTGHSAVLTHEMTNTFCILIHWLNTVLWTVKNMQLCVLLLIKEFKNGFQDWQKKKSQFFLYVCSSIFSLHKCIIYKYSNGVYRVAVRCSTQKSVHVSLQDLHKPCFSREKYPSASPSHLYSCYCFLAQCTIVNNCFKGWPTGRVKFHQKLLTNTLRAHWEWQPLPLNQADALVSHTHAKRSNILLVLWLCCIYFSCFNKNIKK